MLLKEIKSLTEEIEIHQPVIDYIHRNCQPYLNEVGNDLTKLMWRGVSRNFIRRIPAIQGLPDCSFIPGHYADRQPRDTHEAAHKIANELMVKHHGLPFRNGVFVTGSHAEASDYGEPVLIFPIGEFKYCWSPTITDLSDHVPGGANSVFDHERLTEKLDKMFSLYYKTTDLKNAIFSENEIMLYCDKCLMYIPGG